MKRTCTIAFNDGHSMKFAFGQQADDSMVGRLVDDALDRNSISFEVEGQLLVFPMANIRSITVAPAPAKLPQSVIQGASMA
ncbi:MAG: hypothetical protein GKR91_17400 [Pseudomonadales bacterium]|nr:hypothetical protein [Pseudomonadales bacterium]